MTDAFMTGYQIMASSSQEADLHHSLSMSSSSSTSSSSLKWMLEPLSSSGNGLSSRRLASTIGAAEGAGADLAGAAETGVIEWEMNGRSCDGACRTSFGSLGGTGAAGRCGRSKELAALVSRELVGTASTPLFRLIASGDLADV